MIIYIISVLWADGGIRMSELFRKKSLDKVSSPEELNDYIRVTTPSVWLILAAVLILVIGILAWCVLGTVKGYTQDGQAKEIHPISFIIN